MEAAVERGIERPAIRHGRAPKYPFRSLVVDGDSLFIPVAREDEMGKRRIRSAATDFAKRHGVTLLVRVSQRIDGIWGMRVWRTA